MSAERQFTVEFGSHTPASYRERLRTWYLDDYDPEFGVDYRHQPARNADELAARKIGDAERVALTLLDQESGSHPIARWWVERIVRDISFAQHLDQFERQTPEQWLDLLRPESPDWDERGLHLHHVDDVAAYWSTLQDAGYVTSDVWTQLLRFEGLPSDKRRLDRELTAAAVTLAWAVVDHRLYREGDTEHTSEIGAGYHVTTSLAAAVAEYVRATQNAWAGEVLRLQDQL